MPLHGTCRFLGVIEYLEKGRVPADHADFRELIYKKALTKMLSHSTDEKHYTHGFNVSCATEKVVCAPPE